MKKTEEKTITLITEDGSKTVVLKSEAINQKLHIKHRFTDEEYMALSESLAIAVQKHTQLQAELKEYASQMKSRIAQCEALIALNSSKITNRYEMREESCYCIMQPRLSLKQVFSALTGEFITTMDMTAEDFQMGLPMEVDNPKKQEPIPMEDGEVELNEARQ